MVNKSKEETDKTTIILDAAQKRFGHYGLQKTTMTEIATDIGTSKASLYYYFPDKEELFKAVIKREQDVFIANIEAMISSRQKAQSMLEEYVKRRLLHFRSFVNMGKLTLEGMRSVKPLFAGLSDAFFKHESDQVENILRKGVASGELRRIDTRQHAELFAMLLQGIRAMACQKVGIDQLREADHEAMEKNSMAFTGIFYKGISSSK